MSSFQPKITRRAKKQEGVIHSEGEEKQSVETASEMVHLLYLANKDFEEAIINVFKELKKTVYKELMKESSGKIMEIETICVCVYVI